MLNLSRERFLSKEEFALEVLISVLKTGRGKKVLKKVVENLVQKGLFRLAEEFSYVEKAYSEKNPVDAFYYAGLLSEEIYTQLKIAQSKGTLTAEYVTKVLEEFKKNKGAWVKILKGLATPLFYTFLASFLLTTIVPNTVTVLEKIAPDKVPYVYRLISQYPFFSFLLVFLFSSLLVVGIAYFLFRKTTFKFQKLYRLAQIAYILRMQKIPYAEIFSFLSKFEKKGFWITLWEDLSERSKNLPIYEVVSFMEELLPLPVYLTFLSYLERGEEIKGWNYLKSELENILENRYNFLASALPVLGFGILALLIFFAVVPMFLGIFAIISLFSHV